MLQDYHNVNPPIGYKFVPAGDPTLTTKCKEFARLDGRTVYKVIVSLTWLLYLANNRSRRQVRAERSFLSRYIALDFIFLQRLFKEL